MRVIAGKYKGRKLVSFDQDHIRPMTDRVKESVFNIISAQIDGARVLDLFSGTGNIGLEALSRNAASVTFVEKSQRSIIVLRKNVQSLKIEFGTEIKKDDVLRFLQAYKGPPYEIVFADPPFPARICSQTLENLSKSGAITDSSLVIIEHSKHEPLEPHYNSLRRVDSRSYGDKLVSFYRLS